jgi:hypothetical protein
MSQQNKKKKGENIGAAVVGGTAAVAGGVAFSQLRDKDRTAPYEFDQLNIPTEELNEVETTTAIENGKNKLGGAASSLQQPISTDEPEITDKSGTLNNQIERIQNLLNQLSEIIYKI